MRKIPVKNYIICVIISVITLILVYTLRHSYLKTQEKIDNKYMSFLSEILDSEIDNYVVDSKDVMIYITDLSNKELLKKIKQEFTKNNYSKQIVYLNMNNLSNDFYDNFSMKYNVKKEKIKSDSLIIIKEGKVLDIINLNEKNLKNINVVIERVYGE